MSYRLLKAFKAYPLRDELIDYANPTEIRLLQYYQPVSFLSESVATNPNNAPKALRDKHGEPVNRIEKGRYEIIHRNGSTTVVVVEDSDAP